MKNCPRCNAPNQDVAAFCQSCGSAFPDVPPQSQPAQPQPYYQASPIASPYAPGTVYPPAPDPIAAKNQRKIQKIIAYYAQHGYKVTSQTDTSAQLTKEKSFSCLLAVLLLVLGGLPFFIYLIYYLSTKEARLLVTLNPDSSTTFAFNNDQPVTNHPVNGETKLPLQDDSAMVIFLIALGFLLIVAYALMTAL